MNYVLGLGADAAVETHWCSTVNRQGSCSPLAGVCKPMDTATLILFKELQSQLNRVAHVMGFSKTDVDGRIGKGTLGLYNKVQANSPFLVQYTMCDQLASATLRGAIISTVKSMADGKGAPLMVSVPITSRPSTPNPNPSLPPSDPPLLSITDGVFGLVSSPIGLLIAAGLGYGAYRLYKGGKKGGGRRRKRARRNPHTVVKRKSHWGKGSAGVRAADWLDSTRSKRERAAADERHRRRRAAADERHRRRLRREALYEDWRR